MRRCRECGCLEDVACVRETLLGDIEACHWIEEDLCSACGDELNANCPDDLAWEHPPRSLTDRFAVAP